VEMFERRCASASRQLVEECFSISVSDLQHRIGRKAIIGAARDARPLRFQLAGLWLSVYVCHETHRLPGRTSRWSGLDRGDVRLYLVCIRCRHRFRILYLDNTLAVSDGLACRECLHLRYQSQNSWNRKWWRETAVPLKRRLRRRQRLLARKQTAKVLAQLAQVDELIWIIRQRVDARARTHGQTDRMSPTPRAKRPYRDLVPILQSLNY